MVQQRHDLRVECEKQIAYMRTDEAVLRNAQKHQFSVFPQIDRRTVYEHLVVHKISEVNRAQIYSRRMASLAERFLSTRRSMNMMSLSSILLTDMFFLRQKSFPGIRRFQRWIDPLKWNINL